MRFLWQKTAFVVVLATSLTTTTVRADFGDYADHSFNCPAQTTCPMICVATVDDCPTACNANETLCADGTCVQGECDDMIESPCEAECASTACPKVVDYYPDCKEKYRDYYDAAEECQAQEIAETVDLLGFNETGYVFAYVWVSVLTVAMLVWCAINQRVNPAPAVQVNLEGQPTCWQTGYRWHWLGHLLFVNILLTFMGWIALLIWLPIQYYALEESQYVSKRKIHFEDEIQLLKTFIIVWSVGFTWCFALKWPYSIQSLFWRRCNLDEADHVAFFQELATAPTVSSKGESSMMWRMIVPFFENISSGFTTVMSTIFSDKEYWHFKEGTFIYAPVKTTGDGTRYLVFSLQRYNFDTKSQTFLPATWSIGTTLGELAAHEEGMTTKDRDERVHQVGLNAIEMQKPNFLVLLLLEFTKPFYTYQLYMLFMWMPIYYYYMAMVWAGVITVSALIITWFHFRNMANLYRLTTIHGESNVKRDGEWVTLDEKELVPGDIVKLSTGPTYCDMVILSSRTCLVDESALTGESYPQAKSPVDPVDHENKYDRIQHKRHTISAGTTILESEDVIAVVMSTGSATSKGRLLRDIFSFRRHKFKFDTEVLVVLFILFLYALFSFNMVVYFIEDVTVYGWFYGMYVVASVLPALLPTVFTVSVGISDDRLAKQRIATANSESILIAGKVTRAFFDKTGTLTRQGLGFIGSRCLENWEEGNSTKPSDRMTMAMATCHSLTASSEGRLIGNPVDQTMFQASGGKLLSAGIEDATGRQLKVVRHFDFDHHTMTQSVVVQLADGKLVAFVKGSGESLVKLCDKKTLPSDFESALAESARNGVYQISVGSKPFSTNSIGTVTRDQVECDLQLVGCINFQNIIRPESEDVISQLAGGEVISTMVTGDSVLTGIRIANEAGILKAGTETVIGKLDGDVDIQWTTVDGAPRDFPDLESVVCGDVQLAMLGDAWASLSEGDPKVAAELAPHVRVFGRCTPYDKVSVIRTVVELGYVTAMVGDGGNDTGALKAAHVGIALSDAEASMVAPFASLDKDIRAVLEILKEGRCALASALASYKYMIMYGQVQAINQLISAYFQVTFTEWCWVFMDGVWTISLAFTLPLARPAARLSPSRPTASILGLHTMSSFLGILLINFIFTVISMFVLFAQDWFQCRKWDDNDVSNVTTIGDNYESTVLYLVTGLQYFGSAMAFNFGYEFRQGYFRNYWFVLVSTTFAFIHFYVCMVPGSLSCFFRINCDNEDTVIGVTTRERVPIQNPFNTTLMPKDFRVTLLIIMLVNLATIMSYEYFVVNGLRQRWAKKKRAKALQEHHPKSDDPPSSDPPSVEK